MAIDFGTKRVGVAVSRGTLAIPLQVVPHDENLLKTLAALVQQEGVQKIVLGLSENEMAIKTKAFGKELEQHLQNIPIELFDETLSSQSVEKRLQQQGIKHAVRTGPIDHFAAAVILEEWIDQTGFTG